MGLFRAFIIMRMKAVRSLREMARLLDCDPRLRTLCLIKEGEAGYPRSVLSRFARKVGEDNLNKIIEGKIVKLLKSADTRDVERARSKRLNPSRYEDKSLVKHV